MSSSYDRSPTRRSDYKRRDRYHDDYHRNTRDSSPPRREERYKQQPVPEEDVPMTPVVKKRVPISIEELLQKKNQEKLATEKVNITLNISPYSQNSPFFFLHSPSF